MEDHNTKKLIELIAEKSTVEAEDISPESYLEEDLNIGEMELMELWPDIEEAFDIELDEEAKESVETVQDIIDLVEEEL